MGYSSEVHQATISTPGETLPCSAEAERALLAEVMFHPEYTADFPALRPAHFFWRAHIATYQHILDAKAAGRVVHPISLGRAMEGTDAWGEIDEGPSEYLVQMCEAATFLPRPWVGRWAALIVELSQQRDMVLKADAFIADIMNPLPGESLDAIQARGVAAIGAVDTGTEKADPFISAASQAAVENGLKKKPAADAVHTGIAGIDERLKGIRAGELIIVAGRPGMGKSLLANRLCRSTCEAAIWAASFQLEMSSEAVAARLLCDIVRDTGRRVFYSHFRDGSVSPRDRDLILDANAALDQWPLFINDKAGLTIDEIAMRALRAARKAEKAGKRLGLVAVDHIGLVRPSSTYRGNKVAEMTEISNGLKRMAKDLGCGVLALSQLSRAVENREDKRPQLSDLRESGSLEQDADAVLLLYREAYYLKQREATMAPADYQVELNNCRWRLEINIAKCRDGEPGLVIADIDTATGSIRDEGTF